jgi:hypothetical protein
VKGNWPKAVHDHLDAALASHLADALHREDLAGEVRDVADQDHLRLRRDRLLEALVEVVEALWRDREGDRLQDDAVAALALAPGGEHARVVVRGGEDLVARLQVEPELHGLERLAGVARDRHLLGVAAELAGERAAHRLDLRLEQLPHRVDGRFVRQVEVALHRLLHDAWRRADAAVVQVDVAAVDGEGLLDLVPVGLVRGEARGVGPRGCAARPQHARNRVVAERGGEGNPADETQERPARGHFALRRPAHLTATACAVARPGTGRGDARIQDLTPSL